jgi:hypothetical protein
MVRDSTIFVKKGGAQKICTTQFPQGFHSGVAYPKLRNSLKKDPFSGLDALFSGRGFGVTLAETGENSSDCSRSS